LAAAWVITQVLEIACVQEGIQNGCSPGVRSTANHSEIPVLLFPTDLLVTALNELSPEFRVIMSARFLDGESLLAIMRHHRMKKKEVEASIATALCEMKTYMRRRDIRAVANF
jgi:hypothetical protein